MSWQAELQAMGKMAANVPLAPRTTLGVGGEAAWLFRPSDKANLIAAMSLIPESVMLFPLGRGSNVLIADSGIDGLVLDLGGINTLTVEDETIKVGAGVRMSKLAQAAANHGLTGLEFMATVPGDLGGGVAMNAGAFGQKVSDVLLSVDVLHRDGRMTCVSRDALDMRYRYTKLPQGALIVSARFVLEKADTE
ncbi:MAG: FAD-binding protein, partial [Ghiorsea sp.]|nr:FAD-binding protein [Ghiorsea sp.]